MCHTDNKHDMRVSHELVNYPEKCCVIEKRRKCIEVISKWERGQPKDGGKNRLRDGCILAWGMVE
jgi:hypothetical protein